MWDLIKAQWVLEEAAPNSALPEEGTSEPILRDQEKLARGTRWQWALNAQRPACRDRKRRARSQPPRMKPRLGRMGEEAAVRKAGRGQSKGVPPSRVLSTNELCYRKLTQAAWKAASCGGQERNEKAEAMMGKREDRTDSNIYWAARQKDTGPNRRSGGHVGDEGTTLKMGTFRKRRRFGARSM